MSTDSITARLRRSCDNLSTAICRAGYLILRGMRHAACGTSPENGERSAGSGAREKSISAIVFILLLLMSHASCLMSPVSASEPEVRIGLSRGSSRVAISGSIRSNYRAWKFRASGSRLVEESTGKQYSRIRLEPERNRPIRYGNKMYRGSLELLAGSKGIVVVNILDVEDYLRGVVPREIGGGVAREAQRAQAVIARSYTLANMERHSKQNFDLCDSTHCQAYGGMKAEHPRTDEAVRSTRGIIITSHNEPFAPFYSAGCGGVTATPAEAWTGGAVSEHLQSVDCPICRRKPHPWTLELSVNEFLSALKRAGYRLKHLDRINVLQVSGSGRIGALALTGGGETVILSGYALRSAIGYNRVKSTLFKVQLNKKSVSWIKDPLSRVISRIRGRSSHGTMVILSGSGWGHGVGLCQRGAIGLAAQGSGHRSILRRYLPGVDFKKAY